MDRNVVTATVLIAIIMVVWLVWLTPQPVDPPASTPADSVQVDSTGPDGRAGRDTVQAAQQRESETGRGQEVRDAPPRIGTVPETAPGDSTFVPVAKGPGRTITISNSVYEAQLSTTGGTFRSFLLKDFEKADASGLVQLVDSTKKGAVSVVFTAPNNRIYDSRNFSFRTDANDHVEVSDGPRDVTFSVPVGEGTLELRYTFKPDSYEVGLQVIQRSPDSFSTREGYELVWNGGIPFSEKDIEKSAQRTGAYARSGGTVENVSLTSDAYVEQSLRGDVDWVAVKSKYFTVAVLPSGATRGAELLGERFGEVGGSYLRHDYVASLLVPPADAGSDDYRIYMGPITSSRLGEYDADLYDMVDYGWDVFETVTRPLAKFVFIPVFDLLGGVLPNYGLVIIVLAFLIKLLVYPLTKKSFKSMAKMRELQPRMEAIKEKYGDDPQKQQKAMMKMYKETGVNPLGGCLPMLLQYPIIIALWQFLPQAIEIRQQGFLWAADLSAPDIILQLPFDIPFYGDFVAGFTLLMGISMVFQMRLQMTPSSNAQAKVFTYVMPVMIFVIFNGLAAGLNLYYLCYNVLTAAQQKLINKQLDAEKEEQDGGGGSKSSKKGGRKKSRGKK